jgi:hypothetical protein
MTSPNELCEELKGKTIVSAFIKKEEGKEEYDDTNILQLETADGSIFEVKGDYGGYTGNSQDEYPALISIVKRFTPKIEKFKENNNQQDKNLEGNRDVNSKKGLHDAGSTPAPAGFSTPNENCEICKDYPKEYWCGNPKNKVSTPNEEQLKEMDKAFERQSDENEDYKEW